VALGKDGEKEFVPFKDATGQPITREVVQVDQIFTLPKGDTTKLVEEIKRTARGAGLDGGSLLGIDRAGNGAGVHDLLVRAYSGATRGFNGSSSATVRRIMEEDTLTPADEYADLLSEMWYSVRKYIEFGFMKISPLVPSDPLLGELTGRRALLGGKRTKVEPKRSYKSRGHKSPDRADALAILLQAVRASQAVPPSYTRSTGRGTLEPFTARIGVTDRMDYL